MLSAILCHVNSATTPGPAAGTTAEPEAEIADVDMLLIWPKLGADSFARSQQLSLFQLGIAIQGPHPVRTECIRSLSRLPMSPKKGLTQSAQTESTKGFDKYIRIYVLHRSGKVSVAGDV